MKTSRTRLHALIVAATIALGIPAAPLAAFPIERLTLESDDLRLIIEVLDDDLFHFEYTPTSDDRADAIPCSPMIYKQDYTGPSKLIAPDMNQLITAELQVDIDPTTLALTITETRKGSPRAIGDLIFSGFAPDNATFTIFAPGITHAYGLGEQFFEPPHTSANWIGRKRSPGCEFGNRHNGFLGGAVGNNMFPILYALGEGDECFAIFLDDTHAETWDFTRNPWTVTARAGALRGYILSGPNLRDLRRDYMELVGRPPVPPKKAFGLWISEYGFDDWAELDSKLKTLRARDFPIDGFVLDLQWFGDVEPGGEQSQMGRVAWDRKRFPRSHAKISQLAEKHGVGLVLIEESYITRGLPEHRRLAKKNFLVKDESGDPIFIKSWWGHGGMLDWLNPAAADDWHDAKRQALIADGVLGHWTDLGEPEDYKSESIYADGIPHADAHNLYNFRWVESIARGYKRNKVARRPFILSRSGITGIHRFGAAMWSGDTGSNMPSLAEHYVVQSNMSLSGMDYFGADIGGFHRKALDGDLNDLYTQWFADAAAVDVPVRPHTANRENKFETAPDRVGDLASNLANIRRRYELIPYLYSLAHRACRTGDPVSPPLVFCFATDGKARDISDQKMIGDDLLVALTHEYGAKSRNVYLPAGTWYDWHTDRRITSRGEELKDIPLYDNGRLQLPLYARAGAIIPMMHVDDQTMNAMGLRKDGARRDELILRVFAGGKSSFTLYEDDGETTAYQRGEVQDTKISQQTNADGVTVIVSGSEGGFKGAPNERFNVIRLTTDGRPQCSGVTLNGKPLPKVEKLSDLESAPEGWCQPGRFVIVARTRPLPVKSDKSFDFSLTAD